MLGVLLAAVAATALADDGRDDPYQPEVAPGPFKSEHATQA
jgi:hypothetical protein